jgi:hypothetical protein
MSLSVVPFPRICRPQKRQPERKGSQLRCCPTPSASFKNPIFETSSFCTVSSRDQSHLMVSGNVLSTKGRLFDSLMTSYSIPSST